MAPNSTKVKVEIRIHYQEIKKIFLKHITQHNKKSKLIKDLNDTYINPKL